ncbi:unnamed protein product [Discosporangium mesarthrocarpum]
MKRKRPVEYDEDEKLLHQSTKAIQKEAKRLKTFLLQRAVRKSKASSADGKISVSGGEAQTVGNQGSCDQGNEGALREKREIPAEITAIKSLPTGAVLKLCLRQLGLAHTGEEGREEVKVEGGTVAEALVQKILEHKRMVVVMGDLQERVTARRRQKLAELEGRSLSAGKGKRWGKGKGKHGSGGKGAWGMRDNSGGKGQRKSNEEAAGLGSMFLSLSGEAPSDNEWASHRGGSRWGDVNKFKLIKVVRY